MPVPAAMADDDDDGGGGGQSAGGGSSGSGYSGSQGRKFKKEIRRRAGVGKSRRKPAPAVRRARAPRQLIVALDLRQASEEELRRLGFEILRTDTLQSVGSRIDLLRPPRNTGLAASRAILARLGAAATDLNSVYRPEQSAGCVNADCSGLELVGVSPDNAEACNLAPRIGLIDTRVDTGHPALAGHPVTVLDLKPPGTRPSAATHGTAVAQILVGSRNFMPPGLLPAAPVTVAVPYQRSARGNDIAMVYDIVRSIDALAVRNMDVINMSLAGPANLVLEQTLLRVYEAGTPVVAAVGNSGARSGPQFPAAYESAIAVTAVSTSLKVYRRAGQGPHVDFAAPGVGIEVPAANGNKELKTGTSFAVPYVSAAFALLRHRNPEASLDDLLGEAVGSARDIGRPGKDRVYGWGLIQFADACKDKSQG